MKLPNLDEARKRTNNEIEFITLDQNYDSETFKNQKYFLRTYGCQMNVHDGEEIAARLETLGFTSTETLEEADIVILNTCAIRENAHNKVFGMLGRLKHTKESRPIMIGLCGCMAQEESVVEDIKTKYKWVDIVFGTHNIHKLPNILEESLNKQKQEIEVYSIEGDVYEYIPVKRDSKYKAWVNIQYGCDKFCTYCIVPYTRGKQRSRLPIDIINEVKDYSPVDIKTLVYPGFATDLQQVMATFLTQCNGKSIIEETIYENRFQNLLELEKMGASFKISKDNRKAVIKGKTELHGAEVNATDLRGGASLLVAGLLAEGTTTIDNISYILRGYDKITEKLTKVGAKIEII